MEQWRKNVYVLWVATFVAAVCWTMVMPFFPVYLTQLGVASGTAEFWSGVIISVAAVCSMVTAPIWGVIGDRYGRRLMMLRAGIVLVIGYVLVSLVQGPWQLLLVRAFIGALSGFIPMAIALVGVSTPQEHMGWALGIVQTGWPSGAIIGPVIGGVAMDLVGIRWSSLASAVLIGCSTLLVMLTVRETFTPAPRAGHNLLGELQAAASHRVLMAVIVVSAIAQATVMALEPVLVPFVQQIAGADSPGWVAGLLFALPGLAFITMATWWARRGEQVGFARTVGLGLLWSAAFYLPQAFVSGPWQLGFLRLASGVAGAAIGPGVAALLATEVPLELRGRAFGLNQSASSAGQIIGPLLGGYIGSFINPRGVFLLIAVLYLLGWVWVKRAVEPWVAAQAA